MGKLVIILATIAVEILSNWPYDDDSREEV